MRACLLWSAEATGVPKRQASPRAEEADSPSRDEGKTLEKWEEIVRVAFQILMLQRDGKQ